MVLSTPWSTLLPTLSTEDAVKKPHQEGISRSTYTGAQRVHISNVLWPKGLQSATE